MFSRKQVIVLVIIVCLIPALHLMRFLNERNVSSAIRQIDTEGNSVSKIVHVSGAVEHPGIYGFEAGTTLNDVLKNAVVKKNGDLTGINSTTVLSDGQVIFIPSLKVNGKKGIKRNKRININNADSTELETLPGIGPVLAERIIERRNTTLFRNPDDLLSIPGIGEKKLSLIKDCILCREE